MRGGGEEGGWAARRSSFGRCGGGWHRRRWPCARGRGRARSSPSVRASRIRVPVGPRAGVEAATARARWVHDRHERAVARLADDGGFVRGERHVAHHHAEPPFRPRRAAQLREPALAERVGRGPAELPGRLAADVIARVEEEERASARERKDDGPVATWQQRGGQPERRAHRDEQRLLPRVCVDTVQAGLLEPKVVRVEVEQNVQVIFTLGVPCAEHRRRVPPVVSVW